MKDKITLNFFGYIISISSNSKSILEQIKYIYRHYISENTEISYYFDIELNSDHKYLVSELLESNDVKVYHGKSLNSMDIWKSKSTFLPPITAEYFSNEFSFFHGCAVRYKNETILFIGPSRSGKTTLSMKYMNNGAQLISDDLIIIKNKDFKILTFKKPIGLRKTSSIFFEEKVQKAIKSKPGFLSTFYIESLDLTSELIHAEEIEGWTYFEDESKIDQIFFLSSEIGEINGGVFLSNMLRMNYQCYDPIRVISNIYKNLNSLPKFIPLHHREIID